MNCSRLKASAKLLFLAAISAPVFAQIDLPGSWMALNQEDRMGRMSGPYPADYTGLPLNEWGRALAELSAITAIHARTHLRFLPPTYLVIGPFSLKIWNERLSRSTAKPSPG